jgi:hypothetical protein
MHLLAFVILLSQLLAPRPLDPRPPVCGGCDCGGQVDACRRAVAP